MVICVKTPSTMKIVAIFLIFFSNIVFNIVSSVKQVVAWSSI